MDLTPVELFEPVMGVRHETTSLEGLNVPEEWRSRRDLAWA